MNPDQFFERDANNAEDQDTPTGTEGASIKGGATDIFGTVPPPLVTEWSTVPEIPIPATPVPTPAPAQEPTMARTPLPIVHEVVFKANSSSPESADPLHQLLRSAPPASRPVEPPPPAPAGSGGFTQLLRTLNYDQAKPTEAPPVVAASPVPEPVRAEAGSITQLLRTIDHPVMTHGAVEHPAQDIAAVVSMNAAAPTVPPMAIEAKMPSTPQPPSASSAQVTSFRQEARQQIPVVESSETKPLIDAASAGTPVSFTQIFNSLDAKKVQSANVEETPKPTGQVGFTQMFEALGTPKAVAVPPTPAEFPVPPLVIAPPVPTAPAGAFTQMFQTLDAPTTKAVHVEVPEMETPKVETASVLELPPTEHAEAVKVDLPLSTTPGSFTQLFQSPSVSSSEVEEREAPVRATPEPGAASPGSFTQMFRSLDAQSPVSNVEPSRVEVTPPVSNSSGSFTQMFRSLDSQPAEPQSREVPSTPGSFTQMFGTLSSPSPEPSRTEAPPSRPEAGSFTQLFGTLSDSQSPSPPVSPASSFSSPVMADKRASEPAFGSAGVSQVFSAQQNSSEFAQSPSFSTSGKSAAAAPSSGGLTQLLRTLDQSPQPAVSYGAPVEPVRPATQQAGTFTSAYGSLNTDNASVPSTMAPAQIPPAPTQATPPVSAGPSEFTRILNASMFRESVLRGGESAAAGAAPQIAQPTPAAGFPSMAMPSVSAPSISGGGVTLPKAPQIKAPEIPKPTAPAVGKMQQMLPLLLILIIFVLIAILVAVIILMKH